MIRNWRERGRVHDVYGYRGARGSEEDSIMLKEQERLARADGVASREITKAAIEGRRLPVSAFVKRMGKVKRLIPVARTVSRAPARARAR